MRKIIYNFLDLLLRVIYPSPLGCKLKSKILKSLGAQVGKNIYLDTNVYLKSPKNLVIGNDVVISAYSVITAAGGVVIGNEVMIGYATKILSQNHKIPNSLSESIRFSGHDFKKTTIEEGAWLGSNVIILPGVNVGKGAIVGAGSVVTKDVPPYTVYAGIPARLIKNRR